MRIGLSYHGGDSDYEAYPAALHRRARVLGIALETEWLAGTGREARLDLLDGLEAFVLTGGPDVEPERYGFADLHGLCKTSPERDEIEWQMLERLTRRPLPVLAICRGAQMLNVFHGGTLVPDLGSRNGVHRREGTERRDHDVAITGGSRLHALVRSTRGRVNSSHHQAVERLAPGFRIGAVSDDGVVEAFERAEPGYPLLVGVQWHPEGMAPGEPLADRLLDALLTGEH